MLTEQVEDSMAILADLTNRYANAIWEVGFSGGKDSTLLLHLLVEFLEERMAKQRPRLPKAIYVVYEDTLLDIPPIRQHALKVLHDLSSYSREVLNGLLKPMIVRPARGRDFFSMMIEQGYPAPHYRFRWCVRVLKVGPVRSFLAKLTAMGKVIMLTGLRADESNFRRRVIRRRMMREKENLIKVAPLLNWREEQVFAFIRQNKQPWNGHDYSLLLAFYKQLSPTDVNKQIRYGCWTCTVIRKEKALYELEKSGLCPYAGALARAKEALRDISQRAEFRVKGSGKWRFGRLNKLGRSAVKAILAWALTRAPEGLTAYIEVPYLREKLMRWLKGLLDHLDWLRDVPLDVHIGIVKEALDTVSTGHIHDPLHGEPSSSAAIKVY